MKPAYVVGSGPNGLTAAILLAEAGVPVVVLEAQPRIGGGARTEELTLPGFRHDLFSAVHPMAAGSPVLRRMPLAEHGLAWIHSPDAFAHPFDDGRVATASRAWQQWFGPLAASWDRLAEDLLAPPGFPRHPLTFARFAMMAPWPAAGFARTIFRSKDDRALFAGCAAHSALPLNRPLSAAFGVVLALTAQAVGWPFPRGGAQAITDALASYLRSLGGEIQVNTRVASIDELRDAGAVLCDVSPRQLLSLAGEHLPADYCRRLEAYRYGPGVFKLDWALDAPIPWRAAGCARAATIHLGGTLDEIAESELEAWQGVEPRLPFVILTQPSLFDSTRAPAGLHTAWAYCHVPNGSTVDCTEAIESQVERFALGFRASILARHAMNTARAPAAERESPGRRHQWRRAGFLAASVAAHAAAVSNSAAPPLSLFRLHSTRRRRTRHVRLSRRAPCSRGLLC